MATQFTICMSTLYLHCSLSSHSLPGDFSSHGTIPSISRSIFLVFTRVSYRHSRGWNGDRTRNRRGNDPVVGTRVNLFHDQFDCLVSSLPCKFKGSAPPLYFKIIILLILTCLENSTCFSKHPYSIFIFINLIIYP